MSTSFFRQYVCLFTFNSAQITVHFSCFDFHFCNILLMSLKSFKLEIRLPFVMKKLFNYLNVSKKYIHCFTNFIYKFKILQKIRRNKALRSFFKACGFKMYFLNCFCISAKVINSVGRRKQAKYFFFEQTTRLESKDVCLARSTQNSVCSPSFPWAIEIN